jgi:hypothetical protein
LPVKPTGKESKIMAKVPKKLERKPVKPTGKESTEEVEDTDVPKEEEESEDSPKPERISSTDGEVDESPEEVDYLQKYQYKKVNNVPQVGGVLTDPDKGSKAERMKAHLLSQRRVEILIPLEQGSSPKVPYSWGANGYRLDFPVNQYVTVPKQVSDDIKAANNQTITALNQFRAGEEKAE